MILSEQACVVLGPDGAEVGWFDPWSDEADAAAKAVSGYVVKANSEPEHVFADFRHPVLAEMGTGDVCVALRGWDLGPDGDHPGHRIIRSDNDETRLSLPANLVLADHSRCPDIYHDRSLPEDGGRPYAQAIDPRGFLSDKQSYGADGLLACNDCGLPTFYCTADNQYHHVNRDAACFLVDAW